MTLALAQSLLLADAVTPDQLGEALLLSATRGASLVRSLNATGAIDPMRLEQHLEKGEAPTMRHVAAVMPLVERLPPGLCERLLALPVRHDPRTGTVDVAVVDARDSHAAEEIAFWLRAPVRVVRTPLTSMDAALRRLHAEADLPGMHALAPPIGAPPAEQPRAAAEPGTNPNIPIPLTRRSIGPLELRDVGAPAVERDARATADPVLNLSRRKAPGSRPGAAPISSESPESPPPSTQRGPFPAGPKAPAPAPDARPTVEALKEADDRDRIVELLVTGARSVAGRVAVLAVRRDGMVGWACSPEVADQATFRKLRISTSAPTVLGEALEQGGAWLVRLPRDLAHAPLLDLLKQSPLDEIAAAGARVEGRPALAILAAGLADASLARRHLAELALAAGEALARLLRDRRK